MAAYCHPRDVIVNLKLGESESDSIASNYTNNSLIIGIYIALIERFTKEFH